MKLKKEQVTDTFSKLRNSKQDTTMQNQDILQNDEIKAWQPTFKWFAIAGSAVLLFLVAVFFIGNLVLRPYMIEAPKAITPWLDSKKETPPFVPAFDVNKDIK